MSSAGKLTVYYDGACPLCRREITFYQGKRGADAIHWIDVADAGTGEVAPGLSKALALSRFHILDDRGRLVSGGAAFSALWQALPGFRPLGRLFRIAPFAWLLERAYLVFLRIRPRLQALAGQRADRPEDVYPDWLVRDLRSDHAGETGAVAIYHGILAMSRDPEVRTFAAAHLETEQGHLDLLEDVLSAKGRSLFLPLWRVAGFLTGALPGLFGREAVFATIDAVETFVDHHYAEQVGRLSQTGTHPEIRDLLERCRLDEVHHRDEARHAASRPAGVFTRIWCSLVAMGSAVAVALARRV